MIDLPYSLIIEATDEPDFFGFYSPDLEGFTGIGHSIEDGVYQARWAMKEFSELLESQGLKVPPITNDPRIMIQNSKESATAKFDFEGASDTAATRGLKPTLQHP
jgi:predicted RNase H-like HicB family nuclease